MGYFQNQILHKKLGYESGTVFMCEALICFNLYLKLQKVDKGDGSDSKTPKL